MLLAAVTVGQVVLGVTTPLVIATCTWAFVRAVKAALADTIDTRVDPRFEALHTSVANVKERVDSIERQVEPVNGEGTLSARTNEALRNQRDLRAQHRRNREEIKRNGEELQRHTESDAELFTALTEGIAGQRIAVEGLVSILQTDIPLLRQQLVHELEDEEEPS